MRLLSHGEFNRRFARSRDILCQAAAPPPTARFAMCLASPPSTRAQHLLFERFVSEERREPPDIDVDFEHERRETVMQWVFENLWRDHAALCSVVTAIAPKASSRCRQGARTARD